MRVLVCGGRNYGDYEYVEEVLTKLQQERQRFTCIIFGAQRGADSLAHAYALKNMIPAIAYPADWKKYGPSAGPIRNKQMLDEGKPDLVVAFPGGNGTENMIRQARAAGIEVIETWRKTNG